MNESLQWRVVVVITGGWGNLTDLGSDIVMWTGPLKQRQSN